MYRSLSFMLPFVCCPPLVQVHAEVQHAVVAEKLDGPTSVAIQPDTGVVFVAEGGAGQVVRIEDGQPKPVIAGFQKTPPGDDGLSAGSPGLVFFDRHICLVRSRESLQVFKVPIFNLPGKVPLFKLPEGETETLSPNSAVSSFKFDETSSTADDGLAITTAAVYVVSAGQLHWIPINGTKFLPPRQLAESNSPQPTDIRGGIAISPRGEIVIASSDDTPKMSLSFISANNGRRLLHVPTDLKTITGLAYSRKSGQLFALDFGDAEHDTGGLYQITAIWRDGKQWGQAKRITTLARPTAMAFANDGSLLVTLLGDRGDSEKRPTGQLIKFEPGL